MKRPASVIAPAFMMGIYAANSMMLNRFWMAVGLIAVIYLIFFVKQDKWLVLGFFMLAMLLGAFRMQQQKDFFRADELEPFFNHQQQDDMTAEGQVLDVRHINPYHTRYEIMLNSVMGEETVISTRMPVIVSVRNYGGISGMIQPGGGILINEYGVTHDLRNHQVEGFLQHWKAQGFQAVLDVKGEDVSALGIKSYPRRAAYLVRKRSERIIDGLLPEPENNVLKSLFFGNQGYLTTSLRELFTRTGTAHLMAVSGLHVGILSLAVQYTLQKIGAGKAYSRGITILLVWFYAAMAGFPISIIRAATMYTLYVASYYCKRHYDAKSVLWWSGLLFLWINPLSLFTVSFQLSFAAVASILWLYPRLTSKLKCHAEAAVKLVLVTLSVQLGTWPIIAWHFGTFSPVSLPANLLLVPFMGLLMPFAMIMIITGVHMNQTAVFMAHFVFGGVRYMLWIVSLFHQLSFSELSIQLNDAVWPAFYYAALMMLAVKLKKRPPYHKIEV